MKIVRLELRAFGPFADKLLDFSSPALHVVYGGNEAGKSSALRAIKALFYGVPANTLDAHRVDPSKLRIAALVRDGRGREQCVVRRKGTKDTLQDERGQTLDASQEAWLTAGTAEPLYGSLFSLSYESLREGAEALLGGAGELGQSLFGAGVGGRAVHDVLSALKAQAHELYRPRGRTQKLNEALAILNRAKEEIRESALQSDAFTKQEEGIESAEREAALLRERRRTLFAEHSRLQRVQLVSPLLSKRAELLRERAELGEVPALASDARAQRVAAQDLRRSETLHIAHWRTEIAGFMQQRAQLDIPQTLAAVEMSVIDDLRDRIGGYKRAQRELPQRRATGERAQEDARRLARALGRDVAFGEGDRVGVSKILTARIREHSLAFAGNAREAEQLQKTLAAKQAELVRARAESRAPSGRAGTALDAPLPLLAALGWPSQGSIDRFEQDFAGLAREHAAKHERERELIAASERATLELDALASVGSVPSEADLTQLRTLRRQRWQALRALLADAPATKRAFAPKAEGHELLAELELLNDQAEQLADRLRREAERVQMHARLSAEQRSQARALSAVREDLQQIEGRRKELADAWRALWKASGVTPGLPQEMRGFVMRELALVERCERLVAEVEQLSTARAEHEARQRAWVADWKELSAQIGLAPTATVAEASAMLEGLADLATQQELARSVALEIAGLERESAAFEQEVRALVAAHLPEYGDAKVELAADALVTRHQRARHDLEQLATLETNLVARRADLNKAEAAVIAAEGTLAQLMAVARVSDEAALEEIERHFERLHDLETQLVTLLIELAEVSDGASIEELEVELRGLRLDEARARSAEIEEQLEELDRQREAVAHHLASARVGLARQRESHQAADAAVEAASQVAMIRAHTERYMQVRIAQAVLEQEIARYRDRHKGPILRAGSELFARLTLGSFTSLDPDYGDSDEPVLVCVRPDGERVRVAGLSAGTRDQLYLALRLASVQHLGQRQELMPLTLDDILVHFDDERAHAALALLGELAQVTQVLFFTHHARLVDLARSALPAGQLVVHELDQRKYDRASQASV